jgi:hypothetical protein
MIPVCLAWGQPSVFAVDQDTIWGCQFELLPGGSMINAPCTLHGVIGLQAAPDPDAAEPIYRTVPGAQLAIWASAETEPDDLMPHQAEILQSYREHLQRLGLPTGD